MKTEDIHFHLKSGKVNPDLIFLFENLPDTILVHEHPELGCMKIGKGAIFIYPYKSTLSAVQHEVMDNYRSYEDYDAFTINKIYYVAFRENPFGVYMDKIGKNPNNVEPKIRYTKRT